MKSPGGKRTLILPIVKYVLQIILARYTRWLMIESGHSKQPITEQNMDLLNHIRDTIATTKAALADGKITADEAKAITVEILELALEILGSEKQPEAA